ncbi:hypothetical protein KHA80_00705 [Anaerobacillus sp. HL2]|nr:hypothetical protein KHA80_00705 [Anaerobacillus sp. HL2]
MDKEDFFIATIDGMEIPARVYYPKENILLFFIIMVVLFKGLWRRLMTILLGACCKK